MKNCPDCESPLCTYPSGDAQIQICWNCGYYASDSQAYKESPSLFINIVRENPKRFIKRILQKQPDGFLQRKRTDKDLTEPQHRLLKESCVTECRRMYVRKREMSGF